MSDDLEKVIRVSWRPVHATQLAWGLRMAETTYKAYKEQFVETANKMDEGRLRLLLANYFCAVKLLNRTSLIHAPLSFAIAKLDLRFLHPER